MLVEGAQKITENEVGDTGEDTADTMFWQRLFLAIGFTRSCHFKSVGGKLTLIEYAENIVQNDLRTVIVCMDRDFDHLFQCMIAHPLVFYTRGYSWENDVFHSDIIRRQIEKSCTKNRKTVTMCNEIIAAFDRFSDDMRSYVAWDVRVLQKGAGLFPRDGSLRPVIVAKRKAPEIDHTFLEDQIRQMKSSCDYEPADINLIDPRIDLYGHCLAKAAYHFFIFCLQGMKKKYKVDFCYFVATSIDEFGIALERGRLSASHSYYSKKLAGAEAILGELR